MRLLAFLTRWLSFLKNLPLLPQAFDGALLMWAFVFRRDLLRWHDELSETMRGLDGVTVHPHRYGGLEFRLGRRELGHVHGNGIVDITLTREEARRLVSEKLVLDHHSFPGAGLVSVPLRSRNDVQRAIAIMTKSHAAGRPR